MAQIASRGAEADWFVSPESAADFKDRRSSL
jgi:hypothetical protein